jgi:hypothetical protein
MRVERERHSEWVTKVRRLWLLALVVVLPVTVALAAVTITGFKVEAGDGAIFVNWETASEIGNLGFHVFRSQSESGTYERLPLGTPSAQFIPSDDFGVGALYEFVDLQVTPGVRYWYKVQDIPASGAAETVGPESAMIPLSGGATPTTPPPATAAPTSTATPTVGAPAGPTRTPDASVRFWADPESVRAGECSTLRWQVSQIRAVYFDGIPVTGQGAQVVCPCEQTSHTLRVQYRDGQYEDFALSVAVTGTCSGTGTGSSPLPTPVLTAPAAIPAPIDTPEQVALVSTPALPPPGPTAAATAPRASAPEPVSPIQTPMSSLGVGDEFVEGAGVAAAAMTPAPDAPARLSGAVEAQQTSRLSLGMMWLVLAAVVGTGMVGGGIWLWKRS